MKKRLTVLALLIVAGLLAYKILYAPPRDGIAARYREQEVTWKQVEQLRSVFTLLGEKGERDDRTLVNHILLGYILADEAKAMGIRVSESEVGQRLSEIPLPDGKSTLQEYLTALGSSLQGRREALTQEARSNLILDRLRDAIAVDYCSEHGIDLSSDDLPAEVTRAVNERIDGLLESHMDEIEYYV